MKLLVGKVVEFAAGVLREAMVAVVVVEGVLFSRPSSSRAGPLLLLVWES